MRTYSRTQIIQWVESASANGGVPTDPITRREIALPLILVPDWTARRLLEAYERPQPSLASNRPFLTGDDALDQLRYPLELIIDFVMTRGRDPIGNFLGGYPDLPALVDALHSAWREQVDYYPDYLRGDDGRYRQEILMWLFGEDFMCPEMHKFLVWLRGQAHGVLPVAPPPVYSYETESGSEGDLVEDDSSGGMNGNSPAEDLLEIPPSVGMASLRVSALYYRVHSRVLSHTRHTITPAT